MKDAKMTNKHMKSECKLKLPTNQDATSLIVPNAVRYGATRMKCF